MDWASVLSMMLLRLLSLSCGGSLDPRIHYSPRSCTISIVILTILPGLPFGTQLPLCGADYAVSETRQSLISVGWLTPGIGASGLTVGWEYPDAASLHPISFYWRGLVWDRGKLLQNLPSTAVDQIISIPIRFKGPDMINWSASDHGYFSLKFEWGLVCQDHEPHIVFSSI